MNMSGVSILSYLDSILLKEVDGRENMSTMDLIGGVFRKKFGKMFSFLLY